MAGGRVGLFVTRTVQLLFAIIVLGVSAHLAHEVNKAEDACKEIFDNCNRAFGRLPESSDYAAFTGAFGFVGAAVGLVATAVSAIPWWVVLNFDILAAIFYLAGGINFAVLRGEGACRADFCREWTASTAFMFLGFFASAVAIGLVIMTRHSNK